MSLPPPVPSPDADHLRLLSIFHYVVGGITALMACIPLVHLAMGIFMLAAPETFGNTPEARPPAMLGWFFIVFAAAFIVAGQALAACMIAAGRKIAKRRSYGFVFVVACIECLFMPFGTVLGVFTILVLNRPSVKALFTPAGPATPARAAI
jgi:hypothetical protein